MDIAAAGHEDIDAPEGLVPLDTVAHEGVGVPEGPKQINPISP